MAVWLLVKAPVATEKLTWEDWLGTTGCGTGICKPGLLLETEIVTRAPAGIGWTRWTVQVAAEFCESVVTGHCSPERATEAERAMVVVAEEPLYEAVRIALWSVVK